MTTLRGRWAQGLEPRMFCWIIKDRLAASERPGGFARNHRKIRRQEELIWLAQQGFTRVVSLLDSPHNLHAYGEAGIACEHVPLGRHDELADRLPLIYESLARRLDAPQERILLHHEEFGDRLIGVLAGYLIYAGLEALGVHGVLPEEQARAQPFGVDLELEVDLARAGETDDLADTIDYAAVIAVASRIVETERFQLLERLATRIADACREDERVSAVTVTVRNLRPPVPASLDHVGVRVTG